MPGWLDGEATLCRWGSCLEERLANYRRYVEEGLSISLDSPLDEAVAGAILGDKQFVDKVRRRQLEALVASSETPGARQLARSFEPNEVIAAVAANYGLEPAQLTPRRAAHASMPRTTRC